MNGIIAKKLFVEYPNLRSSTRKFDPCISQDIRRGDCGNCKVFVTSDRFLGEKRQVRLVGSARRFPYVIIMDTAGCNLRCWFCYSHHFWKPEESCKPVFLSADEVIEQLRCKLEKIREAEKQMDPKPFTSIRISGGEPIYADSNTLMPYQTDKAIYYKLGIDFWLSLFERLNNLVAELKERNGVNVVLEKRWDVDKPWPWPTFVSDAEDRVYVRFDTNGIAFGNNDEARRVLGGRENADQLISGLFMLHNSGKLNNLKIWITYSFKGVCPNEYYWSQLKRLPASKENEDYDYELNSHPQISGYRNLRGKIDEYVENDLAFKDCVDITVEKGINHDLEHSVYMYNPKAFNWNVLEKKSGINLSDVKNDISIVYTFGGGPWGLYKMTPALIKRYFNRGAEIVVESDVGKIQLSDTYDNAKAATAFIGEHHNDKYFRIIIRPKMKGSGKIVQKPTSKAISLESYQPCFGWVLSGSPSNWRVAFERNIWGVKPKHKALWRQLNEGDPLYFYATSPVSGLIGFAKVTKTMKESMPYWPDEIALGKVKYPYRIEFEPIWILDEANWTGKKISIRHLGPIYFQGINPIRSKQILTKLDEMTKTTG